MEVSGNNQAMVNNLQRSNKELSMYVINYQLSWFQLCTVGITAHMANYNVNVIHSIDLTYICNVIASV